MLSRFSEFALPAFAVLGPTKDPRAPGRYVPLDVAWAERHWTRPSRPDEQLVERYVGQVLIFVATDEQGRPVNAEGRGELTTVQVVCKAHGIFALTDQRLIGMLSLGESPWGKVDDDKVRIVYSIPLEEIDWLVLSHKSTAFGNKAKSIRVDFDPFGSAAFLFYKVVDERRYASKARLPTILQTMIRATAARQRLLGAGQEHLRARSESGHFYEVDGDHCYAFANEPDDAES